MTMRTINPYTSYQTMLDMQRTKDQMAVLNQQLSSGNRLTRLGDDPTASALVLDFQNSIDQNNAYVQQIDSATSFLQTAETALSSVNDSITRVLELGEQGLSGTSGASGRAAIASEVDGIRTNLLAIANTQSDGRYIFAGTKTIMIPPATAPFTGPSTGPITYNGDNNPIDLNVAQSATVQTNLAGDAVFFGGASGPTGLAANPTTDLFQQVTDLRDALKSNNSANIQTAFTNLQNILGAINNQLTVLGGRQASLAQLKDSTQSYNLSLQTIQGSYQDLDYPTAALDYAKAQMAQQASLSVLAKTNNQNLFNYLT